MRSTHFWHDAGFSASPVYPIFKRQPVEEELLGLPLMMGPTGFVRNVGK